MRHLRFIEAFAAALVAGSLLAAASCGNSCGNQQSAQYLSPDARTKVVVFERDCGATTDFSTQASILPANAPLAREPGNVFIADSDHGAAPRGPGGGPELRVKWLDAGNVELAYHERARVFKAADRIGAVRVRYATLR